MRKLRLAWLVWLAAACGLQAQVSVDVLLEQKQFLRDESLVVKVRITNRSGQTLHLGQDADWLHFVVEHRDGHPLRRYGEVDVTGEFTLESASVADRAFDLMPHFDLGMPGRYRVTALVKIKDWGVTVASAPTEFDIVRGSKIWEEDFGVPASEGLPETRKYMLQQAALTKELRLYARITDLAELRVFRVVALGPLVSFSRPEAHIDKLSRLHVLFQTGARSFYYTVVDPDGRLVLRQTYDYTTTRPVLRVDKEGQIHVAGGVRRRARDDLPPPTLEELLRDTLMTNAADSTPASATTNPPLATNHVQAGKKAKSDKAARGAR